MAADPSSLKLLRQIEFVKVGSAQKEADIGIVHAPNYPARSHVLLFMVAASVLSGSNGLSRTVCNWVVFVCFQGLGGSL